MVALGGFVTLKYLKEFVKFVVLHTLIGNFENYFMVTLKHGLCFDFQEKNKKLSNIKCYTIYKLWKNVSK